MDLGNKRISYTESSITHCGKQPLFTIRDLTSEVFKGRILGLVPTLHPETRSTKSGMYRSIEEKAAIFVDRVRDISLPEAMTHYDQGLDEAILAFGFDGAKHDRRYLPPDVLEVLGRIIEEKRAVVNRSATWLYHEKVRFILIDLMGRQGCTDDLLRAIARYCADRPGDQESRIAIKRCFKECGTFLLPRDGQFDLDAELAEVERERNPSIVALEMISRFDAFDSEGPDALRLKLQNYVRDEIVQKLPYYTKVLDELAVLIAGRDDWERLTVLFDIYVKWAQLGEKSAYSLSRAVNRHRSGDGA